MTIVCRIMLGALTQKSNMFVGMIRVTIGLSSIAMQVTKRLCPQLDVEAY